MLIGGLAGAVTAMLIAPRSGQETRDLLQQKGVELHDEASSIAESATKQVRGKGLQILVNIGEKMGELKQRVQTLIEEKLDDLYSVLPNEKTWVNDS
jgi:gas vesicle protein